jgi:hypothetical protein
MLSASMIAWPLWAFGVLVAIVFYLGLGYLLIAGARLALILGRRALRDFRVDQRARDFGGQAHPTLLEVAVSRAREPAPWTGSGPDWVEPPRPAPRTRPPQRQRSRRAKRARRHPERRAA